MDLNLQSTGGCAKVNTHFTALRPCPLSRQTTWTVDTTTLDDGPVPMTATATDAALAKADEDRTIYIDNTAPLAPSLALAGGDGWHASNAFDLSWEDSGAEHAPIKMLHYSICRVGDAADCRESETPSIDGPLRVSLPDQGEYEFRLSLEDEAGNFDPMAVSSPVTLRYDDTDPGAPAISPASSWLGIQTAAAAQTQVSRQDTSVIVPSGVAGYSITTDGSRPDSSIDLVGSDASYSLSGLPEGTTVLSARAVSGAGVASAEVATATFRVDRSAPSVSVSRAPSAGGWSAVPIVLEATGNDQASLSGMQGAPAGEPLDMGAYMTYSVDGGTPANRRGGYTDVTLAEDGVHLVDFVARDAAGNGSGIESAEVKIDQTAPTGAFEHQNPSDPRQLKVAVSDALSGVAGGDMEYRREGTDGFTRLPTSLADGHLSGRLDDLGLSKGRYEFRAVVTDVAGNRAVIGTRADGSSMTLNLPVRAATKVQVGATSAKKRCVTIKRKRKGEFRKRRKCRMVRGGTNVAYGMRLQSSGTLKRVDGTPVANATVTIAGQPRSGGRFVTLGRTDTDPHGGFRFTVPAGPSQTLSYRYAGTDTDLPSSAAIGTKVTAAARLEVDRRRVRNGQAVRFSGRLLGRPVPKAGKLVALQAKVGRRWRTFATPRANAKGAFKHRYRFTATTGLRRYAFRAVVTREAAYPYERGSSKTVHVTVRGR
jgi:hypothetical protein